MEAFSHRLIKPPMEPVEGDMEDDGLFGDLVKQIALLMIDDDEKLQMTHDGSSAKDDSYLNLQSQRRSREFGPSVHCDYRSPEFLKWEIVHAAGQAVRIPCSGACISRAVYPAVHDNAPLKPCNSFTIGPVFSNFSDGQGEPPVVFPVREVSYPSNFRGKLVKREGSGTGVFIPRSCKLSYIKDARQAGQPRKLFLPENFCIVAGNLSSLMLNLLLVEAGGVRHAHSAASLLHRGQNLRYRQGIHPQSQRMLTSKRGFKGNSNGLDE